MADNSTDTVVAELRALREEVAQLRRDAAAQHQERQAGFQRSFEIQQAVAEMSRKSVAAAGTARVVLLALLVFLGLWLIAGALGGALHLGR
jgi:hypothetical protein